MTSPSSAQTGSSAPADGSPRHVVFAALTGLAALAVVLQGVWAGLFVQYHDAAHRAQREGWIAVHSVGGEIALALAVLATLWAIFRLRSRSDLTIGAVVLTALLAVVAYIGGTITDDGMDSLTPVHIPLAMLALAVAVWLSLRAKQHRLSLPERQRG